MNKKRTLQTVIVVLIALASVLSYVYLNQLEQTVAAPHVEEAEQMIEEDPTANDIRLPDLRLLKKATDMGRRFIPAS